MCVRRRGWRSFGADMATLSVVMMVKDEAANLRRCLPRLASVADEIVILDSGSTDESETVATQYGARWFVNTDWQGYGVQRQRAQALATGDWIFALDADESPDDALLAALARIKDETPGDTVYGMRRLDVLFGRFIDHPLWRGKPYWRLYPRRFQFNTLTVHESLDISGARTQVLPCFLAGKAPRLRQYLGAGGGRAWQAGQPARRLGAQFLDVCPPIFHRRALFARQQRLGVCLAVRAIYV